LEIYKERNNSLLRFKALSFCLLELKTYVFIKLREQIRQKGESFCAC